MTVSITWRWLGSDEAALFAAFENRRAEVPFTVAIGGFFLEGEIDGLDDNGDGAAFLIDYKTGGRAHRLHERSRFVRENGHWLYVDGDFLAA